jgi:hypothetical protein
MKEDIIQPKRYTQNSLECWDFWLKAGLNPLVASAVKYVWRYKYKNGLEDLKKAKVFLEKAKKEKDCVYYTGINYSLNKGDLSDMSSLQIDFIDFSTHTTIPESYLMTIDAMLLILYRLMNEIK